MSGFIKSLAFSCAAFGLLAATSASSKAESITFIESVTGSGTLDGHSFTNALVTITYTGGTAVTNAPAGDYAIQNGTATVSVAGIVGSDTFLASDGIVVFSATGTSDYTPAVGIADAAGYTPTNSANNYGISAVLLTQNPSIGTNNYDLTAPYSVSGGAEWMSTMSYGTTNEGQSAGFLLSSVTSNSMFIAVPEPSSFLMAGTGLLGLAAFRVVRRRRAA